MNPSEVEVTELPSSPGARLRREREARGLTEQQAAEMLNLDPTVVAILEANDFAALGAPVFVKGHLRRYASLLELDVDEVLAAYERSKQHIDEPTLVPKARIEMAPVRGRPRWPLVVGGMAAFLLAAALLAYLSEHGLPWSQKTAEEPALDTSLDVAGTSLPPAASPGPAAIESGPAAVGEGTTAPIATPGSDAATASQGTAPTPGSTASAPGATTPGAPVAGATTPAGASSATPAPTSSSASTVVPTGPGQVSLQLRFSGDSWVEIFDGSGKAVVYDLGKTGTERTVTATAPLSVTLGNAPAVAIMINGRAIPPPPAPGAVARFSVGADGNLR
jgi:cytoskeleton protein RodZ